MNEIALNRHDRRAQAAIARSLGMVQRDADPLTVTSPANPIYGTTPLFDICASDAIVSLSVPNNPLISWIGVENSNVHRLREVFLTYIDAAGTSAATPTSGISANACAPGNSVEWGNCDFTLEGFGRYVRSSPVRDLTVDNLGFWEAQPIYRLDGTPITNNLEWDMSTLGRTIQNDLSRAVIAGNATNAGDFDGLARLIRFGITSSNAVACPALDSTVINWNGNEVAPTTALTGVTVNGAAATSAQMGGALIPTLMRYIRRIQYRAMMSQFGGNSGAIRNGDIAIVLPYEFITCLLDAWTCYIKCGSDITRMDSFEARAFRDSLNGGAFGFGQLINFEGLTIPIIAHDFGMINANGTFNLMVLVRAINSQPVLRMQTLDMSFAGEHVTNASVLDGGRFLSWMNTDNMCRQLHMAIRPRLLLRAPWAQIHVQNIACASIAFNALSSDPQSTRFPGLGTGGLV